MMVGDVDSEFYCDDFYLDSHKKHKSKQFSIRNLANLEKSRLNVLLKVQQLPITNRSAEVLSKLIVNHKIKDIVKVLKVGRSSVTIHAKANIENKAFEKLKTDDNVVIKIFYSIADATNEMYAYSRNIHNEEKNISKSKNYYPIMIEINQDYLYDKIILYQVHNVVIMKMFYKCETIYQMLENGKYCVLKMYREILQLIKDVKNQDYRFWSNGLSSMKDILWWNEKWILINSRKTNEMNLSFKESSKLFARALIDIINLFYQNGIKIEVLQKEFENIFGSKTRWNYTKEVYSSVMNDYFLKNEDHRKLAQMCRETKSPKKPKTMKNKKSK